MTDSNAQAPNPSWQVENLGRDVRSYVAGLPPRKGILLAGGAGTRLNPLTKVTSKQLLPVYDKPMGYYPLTTLMISGIREILVISSPEPAHTFKDLLGDGSEWGIKIDYAVQEKPAGIAQALLIAESWLDNQACCLILGDNIFFGDGLRTILLNAATRSVGATVFGYWVRDPQRYGVIEFDAAGRVNAIREKPTDPKSNYAAVGLYFYDHRASSLARNIKPSSRGELEITDLNRLYLEEGNLQVERLGRGFAWLDAGTHESLLQAGNFVQMIEERQGLKVACPEEVAWRMGYIDSDQIRRIAKASGPSQYADYLLRMLDESLPPSVLVTA
ncbi:MAG TPA: glucose-1-phosphate thymidylyltransferase RfbA [Terriglobales bacterium]|nr:glucose-1-phosphate thymidylyltransferase RfbA [Terriglobales bacterium]